MKTLILILISMLVIIQTAQSQCLGGLTSYSSGQSVDPPTILWHTWCGPCTGCGGIHNCMNRGSCPPNGVQWSCNTSFGLPLFSMSDSCYTIPNSIWSQFVVDTPYYWVAKVMNNGQQNYQVCTGPFKRLYATLPPVTLNSPSNNATGVSLTTKLSWNPLNDLNSVSSYRVKIYSTQGLSVVVLDSVLTADSMHIPPGILISNHTYWWSVKAYGTGGQGPFADTWSFTTLLNGIKRISDNIPENYSLSQNYPNPFNPTTKIKFSIPANVVGQTFLFVYDILGREVATLVNENLSPCTYEVEWDGSNYPSGVYFYKLQTENFSETKRIVLIK